MRMKPYPLEAARKLRTHAQNVAVSEFGLAKRALADAEEAQARASEAVARVHAQRRQAAERQGGRGPAARSGAELAWAGAYDVRLRAAQEREQAVLQRAAAEVRRCDRAVKLAQITLHQAYIEREVIDRHYARFAEAERKRIQRAEDDEMDDLQAYRKPGGPIW